MSDRSYRSSAVSLWPAALFLVLFSAVVFVLEARQVVHFVRPWAFGWLAVVTLLVWWHAGSRSGLAPGRRAAVLVTRLLFVGLLVAALADPRMLRRQNGLSLLYALDVSDSMGTAVSDQAVHFVQHTSAGKPVHDTAGLVVFGREAAVELPPRATLPFDVVEARVARDATDIGRGLSLAAALAPPDAPARVVLVSDGVQTEGSLDPVLDDLEQRGIPVDVLPVTYDFQAETWIERLDLPARVQRGDTYEAVALVGSLHDGAGELVLTENGAEIARQTVSFHAGRNRFALPLKFRAPGYYEYVAALRLPSGRDTWAQNNAAMNVLIVEGEGRILLVMDPQGRPEEWQPLERALRATHRAVDVRSPVLLPAEALAYEGYDAVVLVNVPASAFDPPQLQALRDAVDLAGVGLLMVGGPNSFGPGGYRRTPLEEALPVDMDITQRKVMPAGALVFVVDRSGSMGCSVAGTGFTQQQVANRATVLAMHTLMPGDWVGVVAFDEGWTWAVPFQRVTDTAALEPRVWAIAPGGGTDIYPALEEACKTLEGIGADKAAIRHVILLTDGQSQGGDFVGLVKRMAARKITLSTVAIGDSPNTDLLDSMAGLGGGAAHHVADPNLLPKIFIKEATTLRRNMIFDKPFTPRVAFPSPILKGLDALPPLNACVLTSPKPRAMVPLMRPPENPGEDVDPVLAVWRFGLGQAAAFTSGLGGDWGAAWASWPRHAAFVQQLLATIARVPRRTALAVTCQASGNDGLILVDDTQPDARPLDLQARVLGPRQRECAVPLRAVAPRRYEARFPLWGRGRYQVALAGSDGAREERAVTGFAVSCSPEYLRFRSDLGLLRRIAERTGGRVLSGAEDGAALYGVPRVARASSRPVFPWLLALLAILVPFDAALRRLQVDPAFFRSLLPHRWGGAESAPTLGALLRRRQEVHEALAPAPPSPPAGVPSFLQPPPPPSAADHPAPSPTAAAEPASLSTTGRLLARRRQREQPSMPDTERKHP